VKMIYLMLLCMVKLVADKQEVHGVIMFIKLFPLIVQPLLLYLPQTLQILLNLNQFQLNQLKLNQLLLHNQCKFNQLQLNQQDKDMILLISNLFLQLIQQHLIIL